MQSHNSQNTIPSTSEKMLAGSGEQCVYAACCCQIYSFDLSECQPRFDAPCVAKCCGSSGKGLVVCVEQDEACCICPTHNIFDQTLVGNTPKEDVCCIMCHEEVKLVKPFCLSGEKPVCKGYSEACCAQKRVAFPNDDDVPSLCGTYGITCCDCSPFKFDVRACHKIPPLPPSAQASAVDVDEANLTSEYLICAYGCCILSMYIPDTYADACGCSDNSLCCICVDNEYKGCMLPSNKTREEPVLLLGMSQQARMIKPPIMKGGPLCKGVSRCFCGVAKFAFPCDDEVPFVVAVCGQKLCERTIHGQFKFGDDKKIDVATGKKPLFSKITTVAPKSVKAAAKEGEPQYMERA